MQNNLKTELIAKTGLTAITFLLVGTMAIAQSAPTAATAQTNAKQKTQKKWLPSNFKVVPDKQEAGSENIRRANTHPPRDAQSGQAVGRSAPASAAASSNGHPKPVGQVQGVPLKGGITPKK